MLSDVRIKPATVRIPGWCASDRATVPGETIAPSYHHIGSPHPQENHTQARSAQARACLQLHVPVHVYREPFPTANEKYIQFSSMSHVSIILEVSNLH